MRIQKNIVLSGLLVLSLATFTSPAFSATTSDDIWRKAKDAIGAALSVEDYNTCNTLLKDFLSDPNIDDVARIGAYSIGVSVHACQGNRKEAVNDSNTMITLAKAVIQKRLAGQTSLSQEQIIKVCRMYSSAIGYRSGTSIGNEEPNVTVPFYNAYATEILKLGPFFDEAGKRSILKLATEEGWQKAATLLVFTAKRNADAHNANSIPVPNTRDVADAHAVYANSITVLNTLDWTSPSLLEEPLYAMTMGALVTSDANDKAFATAASNLIKEKKDKSWIGRATVLVPAVNMDRHYELLRMLIDSNPTSVDDNSMANVYFQASATAQEIGKKDEAAALSRILKQKYPNSPLSKSL